MRGQIIYSIFLAILLLPIVVAEPSSVIQITSSSTLEKMILESIPVQFLQMERMSYSSERMAMFTVFQQSNPMDRSQDIELNAGTSKEFQDVAWHPRGNTALITGESGMALRYDTYDHSISNVNGSGAVNGLDMTSVAWRTSGDYAYFGAVDGSIWKFSEGSGFEKLDSYEKPSPVSDISCHRTNNICVVVTLNDGIAVIGKITT